MSDTDTKRHRRGGRERRDPNAKPAAPAYIRRNIPTYDIMGEESLQKIEAAADRILAEVGIDIRDDDACLALFRKAGAKAGLSLKPGTPLEPYLEVLKSFDTLLIMSVEPGFGGQSFIPEVLAKARAIRKVIDSGDLTLLVEIDGGINADTIEQAAEAGIDCFVAGSAVYGKDDPGAAVAALRAQAAAAR